MEDHLIKQKIISGNKASINEALTYIFENWRKDILRLINRRLKDNIHLSLYVEDIFSCGIDILKKI